MIFALSWWRELLIAALFAAAALFFHEWRNEVRAFKLLDGQVKAQKVEAAALLLKLTDEVKAKDAALNASNKRLEADHATNGKVIAAKDAKIGDLGKRVADLVGVRFSAGSGASCRSASGEDNSAAVAASAAACQQFAIESIGVLRSVGKESADSDEYAQTCYRFAKSVETQVR